MLPKSLINMDLSQFIREKGIKSYTEFVAIAKEQLTTGEMGIAEFLSNGMKKYSVTVLPKLSKWNQPKIN